MDSKELHFLTYDPEEMYLKMLEAHIAAGGDIIYPGDAVDIEYRGVIGAWVQMLAGVDNALRMDTQTYAVGDYLDLYANKQQCYRIAATKATCTAAIKTRTGSPQTLKKGTVLTADGEILYELNEDVPLSGAEETLNTNITCQTAGSAGNALIAGMQMQLLIPNAAIVSIYAGSNATGGQEEEEDEAYRERTRLFGLSSVTTGPATQYEAVARAVSTDILDAKALNNNFIVRIVLLLKDGADTETLLAKVKTACSPDDVRPLNDYVTTEEAAALPYTLHVQYKIDEASGITAAQVEEEVAKYQTWQDNTLGRAFNPDKLISALYTLGVTRAMLGTGSSFNNGAAAYTEIEQYQRCKGQITTEVLP